MKQVTAIIIGAGMRGAYAYAPYALSNPHQFKIVGVAEPIEERRNYVKEKYNIPEENCFDTWEKILDIPKIADVALICTQDQMHFEPAMKALDCGYHLLLEKPISPTEEECVAIAEKATEKDLHVVVCHVLRYTTLFSALKKVVSSGRIGKIMAMNQNENVNHIHQSHSFVRGNWGNSQKSTPMILAKCCHDLDIIQWILDEECKSVSSFGELSYFKEENAPEGAPKYCLEGCPHSETCPYDAAKVYVTEKKWGASAFSVEPNNTEKVLEELKTNDYGRCVFRCDNDVVDHQIVLMNFESGATVSLTMSAFTRDFTRTLKIMGTKGEIRVLFDGKPQIEVRDFITDQVEIIYPPIPKTGHGGGDTGIVKDLVRLIATGEKSESLTDIHTSVASHVLAFAAEQSRVEKTTVHLS